MHGFNNRIIAHTVRTQHYKWYSGGSVGVTEPTRIKPRIVCHGRNAPTQTILLPVKCQFGRFPYYS